MPHSQKKKSHLCSPFTYFHFRGWVDSDIWLSLSSHSPGRIQEFHACIQFSAAEAACLWSLFSLPWSPWQWPSSCRPLRGQVTLGVHSDPWEARSIKGMLMCCVSEETREVFWLSLHLFAFRKPCVLFCFCFVFWGRGFGGGTENLLFWF